MIQTWKKQTPWTLRSSTFKRFSAKFVLFSAKFDSLNVQIRNNFNNVIFIAYNWCKICKYYVNSTVISCSTSQKGKKCICVKYLIYAVFLPFLICHNLRVFPPNLYSQTFRVHKKMFFFPSLAINNKCRLCPVMRWVLRWKGPREREKVPVNVNSQFFCCKQCC